MRSTQTARESSYKYDETPLHDARYPSPEQSVLVVEVRLNGQNNPNPRTSRAVP